MERLMAVTLDDVKRIAADVFQPNYRTVGVYLPTGDGNGEDWGDDDDA